MPYTRYATAIALLVFIANLGAPIIPAFAKSGADAMFGSLYGKWRGKGIIVPSAGKPAENISCRVTYSRLSKTAFNSRIRCAAVDYNIDASGKISYSNTSKMFSGRLMDRGTGWILVLSGGRTRKKSIRFGLKISKAEVDGWLDIKIKSKRSHSWTAQRATSKGLKQLLRIKFRR